MKRPQVREEIVRAAEVAAEERGYEIVEVEITKKQPTRVIITVFRKEGVNIDDCAEISRAVNESIDDDLIQGQYTLEVQSPGLDRPIRTKDDYRRNLGNKVEVRLYKKMDDKKDFIGILTDYGDDTVDIREESGETVTFDSKSISLMRQVIEF
ncbi:Ribosome maturation factor RimP [Aedoeadaptatus nemausensis]|uniref:Ribosome maturation factor RimP n=1 Tax=Aedoeadaptatus nemausensis TaxID=2582829 RepID=A0A6V6XZQ9_9FIRM|nr:ribosome maturation factor RimP [Peptoniphilus nemausensis]CAC9924837.1 Ribosome maturation factor RimP [Peptoniphilus nemausensis]